ncbi:coiled-coil domain-containing protein 110 [Anguilla anguilla]|uniref:Uncharacterized protein n=2 Tax=Anguilla anguilla TaxID=7936 RepID=A0A9D3RKP1_ANGAN|nr:coiled-coil domain-containing protein 110 [Anguilla anguilla]XP_035255761.1 coiled-coil domain-containing protein 110 [Anguilla anguilla]XP_035255762.1 coiled-coil domain-containing protein 110 [Anguilla anguilla]XP_035255763.1 coiled-coil domain-containing protein 110 [Anguilla anguilla]XP_035255764.1 coiled-coil domain-containing protein 110 [Anguilla anguilla]XP_035255765.1 coiled-coil domain-containing protein 110 [Anguilla anguilla]XP_035255766.1 coiled-coil domain-containing protein 
MTQSFNESLGSSLHAGDLGDGTILMWHKTIQRLASEGSESMRPREYFHIRTILPSNCCAVGQGNVNEGLLRMLGSVSENGGSENSRPEVAYVAIPLNPSVDQRSSHKQAAGLMPKELVQQGTLKMGEAEMHRISEPQTATAMRLEHINLLLNQMQRPAQRNRITTSTPLPSNELDESEEEFNASVFFSNFQHTIRSVSKNREKLLRELECSEGRSSSVRQNHKDVNKVLEEKLKLKELELQQMVQLLLMMQQDLEEVRGQSDLKDTEIALLAEKLKLEGKQHKENTARFDNTCNSLRGKLLASKADNKTFVKQLRQLLEKYERLKKRASAAKKQSYNDRVDKECAEKTLKDAKQERENLNAEQNLLKKKEETAQRAVSELMEKLRSIENYCEKNVKDRGRLEDEASKMKKEMEHLRNQLQKAQNETLRLVKSMSSIESEKEAAIKQLLESKERVNIMELKLDEYRAERETKSLQIKEMRREAKRSQDKLRAELLLVQENYKACEKIAESMQEEIATLSKLVLDLKQDKQLLKEELENLRQDKKQLEHKSQQEGKRLKEVITLLGKERDLLQMELGDLRKDYLNMSDRIAERMGQLGQDETHMCINECMSIYEEARQDCQRVQHTDDNENVIRQIKKRLEDEEARCIQV